MSVWDKVFKNPKAAAELKDDSLSVPNLTLPTRGQSLPALVFGLSLGTTYTKRALFCQLGNDLLPWKPEMENRTLDFSVYRSEKVQSDTDQELSLGEDALGQFVSDRGDPSCTLFLQPNRFLLNLTKLPHYITTYDGNKVKFQSPNNDTIFENYIRAQYEFLWKNAHEYFSEIRRFQMGSIVVETPDHFSEQDSERYRSWFVNAGEKFFPPIMDPKGDHEIGMQEKVVSLPESAVTLIHWLTDQVEPKLAANELEIKKLMMRHGLLPRTDDPINFLVVTMGATHSRVVRLKVDSIEHLASAKRVGETITIYQNYLGKIGFGGDHISCSFLEEEEERRFGATAAHKVSTLSRKVLEDWGKLTTSEGKKHFDELIGEHYQKAVEKLGDLAIKGFAESPENTVIILGGRVFDIPHLRDIFANHLNANRVPQSRVVNVSSEQASISKVCEVLQFHQKGLGRFFTFKSSLEEESAGKLSWCFGKVVEGQLVETILKPDHNAWDADNTREFTVPFERGVRRLNLGYRKSKDGISQLWANVTMNARVASRVEVTFVTEGPSSLKVKSVKCDGETVNADDFQVEMLLAGEPPSQFPLYDKLLKTG